MGRDECAYAKPTPEFAVSIAKLLNGLRAVVPSSNGAIGPELGRDLGLALAWPQLTGLRARSQVSNLRNSRRCLREGQYYLVSASGFSPRLCAPATSGELGEAIRL
jgi:hypothetical protein